MRQHFQQIDILKCAAIVAVIALHSVTTEELLQRFAVYHIWQAVPVFLVLMGLNLGLGLKKDTCELRSLYTKSYFSKKATRILVPFFVVFVASLILGFTWKWLYGTDVFKFSVYTFAGMLPISGKGNYFITLLLQSILVLPLIGHFFQQRPVLTTVALLLLEAVFLVVSRQLGWFIGEAAYLYSAALPRYFSALAFGLWLAKIIVKPAKTPVFILFGLLAAASMVYLYVVVYADLAVPYIYASWATQNMLSFGYAAFLVLLVIRILPPVSGNRLLHELALIGHASYHIFLVQVVYFGLITDYYRLWLNLMICVPLGFLFYKAESYFSNKYLR